MRSSKPLPFSELLPETFQLPLFSSRVHACFPSPAEDHIEQNIDLNKYEKIIEFQSHVFTRFATSTRETGTA